MLRITRELKIQMTKYVYCQYTGKGLLVGWLVCNSFYIDIFGALIDTYETLSYVNLIMMTIVFNEKENLKTSLTGSAYRRVTSIFSTV